MNEREKPEGRSSGFSLRRVFDRFRGNRIPYVPVLREEPPPLDPTQPKKVRGPSVRPVNATPRKRDLVFHPTVERTEPIREPVSISEPLDMSNAPDALADEGTQSHVPAEVSTTLSPTSQTPAAESQKPRPARLFNAFSEVRRTQETVTITKATLPWLEMDETVHLVEVTLEGTGKKFLLGSLIRGKKLTDAARAMDKRRSQITSQMFYTGITSFINTGDFPYLKLLENTSSVTNLPVYSLGNKSGQRVHFIKLNGDRIPKIKRIAAYDKSDQEQVMSVLTRRTVKVIRQAGKL